MKHIHLTLYFSVFLLALLLTGCATSGVGKLYQKPREGLLSVNPYHVNLHWIDYLKTGKPNSSCSTWIHKYISLLNYPDQYGLTGTMNNYDINSKGIWLKQKSYDSADSYAASFLILLRDYYAKGGKLTLTKAEISKVEDIAWVILLMQLPDGTIKAKPDSEICYLMNNCEDLAGIYAYQHLAEYIPLSKKARFNLAGISLKKTLGMQWKDGEQFYWAISGQEQWKCNIQKIYPDRLAQLYPIAYGLLNDKPKFRNQIWTQFSIPEADIPTVLSPEQQIIHRWAKEALE